MSDAVLAKSVDVARAAAEEEAPWGTVGDHVGVEYDDERVATPGRGQALAGRSGGSSCTVRVDDAGELTVRQSVRPLEHHRDHLVSAR